MRVLLVEDSSPGGDVTRAFLAGHGHEVRLAGSGVEALAQREQWHPDVVLLDLHLPDMKPLDLLAGIRAITKRQGFVKVPVVLTTGATPLEATQVKLDAEKRGLGPVPAILCKPFEPQLLLEVLEQLPQGEGEVRGAWEEGRVRDA